MEDTASTGNSFTAFIETVFITLFDFIKEILGAFFSVLPTALSFIAWVIVAIFVLPCLFVANTIYPLWVEWGEDF